MLRLVFQTEPYMYMLRQSHHHSIPVLRTAFWHPLGCLLLSLASLGSLAFSSCFLPLNRRRLGR